MTKTVTCIICPRGCSISVDTDSNIVTGNSCKRGEEYAKAEVFHPTRYLTTTVKLANGELLPVRTAAPIPKELLIEAVKSLSGKVFVGSYSMGDAIYKNILGTNVNIVACRNSMLL